MDDAPSSIHQHHKKFEKKGVLSFFYGRVISFRKPEP
jgi:hypothetical protein